MSYFQARAASGDFRGAGVRELENIRQFS